MLFRVEDQDIVVSFLGGSGEGAGGGFSSLERVVPIAW